MQQPGASTMLLGQGEFMKKLLAAILCMGFLYRILMLGRRQLNTDELLQALIIRSSSFQEMLMHLREGVFLPAPLDFFIQRCFVLILGESTWALRIHAVVLATLSLWFFFRIARRLFGERGALYSTALLALDPLHYHCSQDGRPFALLILLTLISFDLLMGVLARGRWMSWAVLTLVQALILYSNLLGILVLITQFGCLLVSAVSKSRPDGTAVSLPEAGAAPDLPNANSRQIVIYAFSTIVACIAFVPWLRFVWGSPAIPNAAPSMNWRLFMNLIREIGDNSPFVVALLLAGAVVGARALARHGRRQTLLWLLVWCSIPLLAILILDLRSPGWFATHYVILTVLPLVLLAGYGVSHVGERMTILDKLPYQMSSPAIAYLAILLLASGWIAQSHWQQEPVDWKGEARFLQQVVRPGDAVSMPDIYALLEYYSPSLEEFRVGDSRIPDLAGGSRAGRIIVVCLNGLQPDPCASLRTVAVKSSAWRRVDSLRGFINYMRGK